MTKVNKPRIKVFVSENSVIVTEPPRIELYQEMLVSLFQKLKRENHTGVLM